jgi:putative oxidoreductase
MKLLDLILATNLLCARASNLAQPLFALVLRLYVSWQFIKSGWLKLTSWDTTLWLFENEYRTPLLAPMAAAVAGVLGELVFPAMLIAGLLGRLSALGLFAVNALAVVSYAHVLLMPGMEAALAQHVLWGFMLLTLVVYGPGKLSLDQWLAHVRARPEAFPGRTAAAA